ncbi:MAG: hypothetical protein LBM87_07755 [Ruminococcus sp.]|nr:hypothetical protein [Ruminococcus sp.]
MQKKEGEIRIPSGCAITGFISRNGNRISGGDAIKSIEVMHDRSNGLGGGFAGYGIYPEYKDQYAFHIFYESSEAKDYTEKYLDRHFDIINLSKIPTKQVKEITKEPLIWRYFVNPLPTRVAASQLDEEEYVAQCVLKINKDHKDSFVFSSGKNMGVFKAVGFPEDVGRFYRLDEYAGYSWTVHGRYPTNTPGWWGGAHPFALLDYSIVHNGEISSYDANRRFIEMFGYQCTLQTDTEVITYIIDFLNRKKKLTLSEIAEVIAAPFWTTIERREPKECERLKYLRNVFAGMLITGPFSIILGYKGGLMALNDRLKLRSMVVGEKDDMFYIASEECAIRAICKDAEDIRAPRGGEAVIAELNEEGRRKCL